MRGREDLNPSHSQAKWCQDGTAPLEHQTHGWMSWLRLVQHLIKTWVRHDGTCHDPSTVCVLRVRNKFLARETLPSTYWELVTAAASRRELARNVSNYTIVPALPLHLFCLCSPISRLQYDICFETSKWKLLEG